ncbi:MAG: GrpB family protein [archaeon]|jgi:GrpB-like predicted nucleotidyltransferase (UPF0157 family)
MTSLENAISNRYKFKSYSPSFPKLFLQQKRFVLKRLNAFQNVEVHHIGSTSVPTLGGKGILDIIVEVDKKNFSKAKKILHESGFLYDHTMRKKRHFHRRYYVDFKGVPRLVHLHLTYFGSGEIEIALAFREYLRAHKKVREQYAQLKKKASHLHSKEGKKYVKFKLKFIESTLKKALKWYEKN